jgi:hypothetical protein
MNGTNNYDVFVKKYIEGIEDDTIRRMVIFRCVKNVEPSNIAISYNVPLDYVLEVTQPHYEVLVAAKAPKKGIERVKISNYSKEAFYSLFVDMGLKIEDQTMDNFKFEINAAKRKLPPKDLELIERKFGLSNYCKRVYKTDELARIYKCSIGTIRLKVHFLVNQIAINIINKRKEQEKTRDKRNDKLTILRRKIGKINDETLINLINFLKAIYTQTELSIIIMYFGLNQNRHQSSIDQIKKVLPFLEDHTIIEVITNFTCLGMNMLKNGIDTLEEENKKIYAAKRYKTTGIKEEIKLLGLDHLMKLNGIIERRYIEPVAASIIMFYETNKDYPEFSINTLRKMFPSIDENIIVESIVDFNCHGYDFSKRRLTSRKKR